MNFILEGLTICRAFFYAYMRAVYKRAHEPATMKKFGVSEFQQTVSKRLPAFGRRSSSGANTQKASAPGEHPNNSPWATCVG